MIPEHWRPEHKRLPFQVGFTRPPFDRGAPADCSHIAPQSVCVHGWLLLTPDYAHELDQHKDNFGMIEDFCHAMPCNSADAPAQVGQVHCRMRPISTTSTTSASLSLHLAR